MDTARCPQCNAELQNEGSPQGICPACLMQLGLSGAIPSGDHAGDTQRERPVDEAPAEIAPPPAQSWSPRTAGPLFRWPRTRLAWIVALTLIIFGAAMATRLMSTPTPGPPEARLTIATPDTTDPVSLAISPDGRHVVFAGVFEGRPQLWLRPMESTSARPLAVTEGASYPFWSPDSRHLGFFQDRKLKRLTIDRGSVQILANAPQGCGGTWSPRGEILFVPECDGPISRVPVSGGEPTPLWQLEAPGETGHRFPQLLPGGRNVLFYVAGRSEVSGVYVGSIETGERRRLLAADAAARYATMGHVLFVRDGTLFASAVDLDRLEITGDAFPVADRVAVDGAMQVAAVSTSEAGTILYRSGEARELRQVVWSHRNGRREPVGEPDTAGGPVVSPDGRRVAFDRTVNGNRDVWLLDTARGVMSRFTFDPSSDARPIWSPDGTSLAFQSNRKGANDIFQKPANRVGDDELLLGGSDNKAATDWSPDGRFLLYQRRGDTPKTGWDIWALPLGGDRKPWAVVETNFDDVNAQFSPDGRWIAYQSNESGRFEVYVQSFPRPDAKAQITIDGGAQARWRRDGRELFWVAPDGMLRAVPMFLRPGRPIEPGQAQVLFPAHVGAVSSASEPQYDVSPDGQRFVLNTVTNEPNSTVVVILNWKAAR